MTNMSRLTDGASARLLKIGSREEVAAKVQEEIDLEYGGDLPDGCRVVHAHGAFWGYDLAKNCWVALDEDRYGLDLRGRISAWDGAYTPDVDEKKAGSVLKLAPSHIADIARGVRERATDGKFFSEGPQGVSTLNGFVARNDGVWRLTPAQPFHRQRWQFPGRFDAGFRLANRYEGSLLQRLFDGVWRDKPEGKDNLSAFMQELFGAVILGLGPCRGLHQPPAVFFVGKKAGNGKSQIITLLRSLLPTWAVSASPPHEWKTKEERTALDGKALNIVDELSPDPIRSKEAYKAVIFGDLVSSRRLYHDAGPMAPHALHVFGTNDAPTFERGIDEGTKRRSWVVPFTWVIEKSEEIPDLGARIIREEADLLLHWALAGAARVLDAGGKFTVREEISNATMTWAEESDTVREWLADMRNEARIARAQGRAAMHEGWCAVRGESGLFKVFSDWLESCGQKMMTEQAFVKKLQSLRDVEHHREAGTGRSQYRIIPE